MMLLYLAVAVVRTASAAEPHGSPWSLDLDRFVNKLVRDQSQYFPDVAIAKTAIAEYRRFLHLHQKYPEHWVAASKLVDIVWHEHIIDTRRYMADSDHLFGHYLHHTPCFGKGRDFHHQNDMVNAYEKTFGEFPREDVWEIPHVEARFPGCKTFPAPPGPPAPCPPPPPPSWLKLNFTVGKKEELCIDGGSTLGSLVTLQKCNASSMGQGFDPVWSEISIGDRSFFPGLEEGRCVELVDGKTTNGNHFTMECCKKEEVKNYTKQMFSFNYTTGKISYGEHGKPATKCIYAKAGQAGETLMIWDCQEVDGQKWIEAYRPYFTNSSTLV